MCCCVKHWPHALGTPPSAASPLPPLAWNAGGDQALAAAQAVKQANCSDQNAVPNAVTVASVREWREGGEGGEGEPMRQRGACYLPVPEPLARAPLPGPPAEQRRSRAWAASARWRPTFRTG